MIKVLKLTVLKMNVKVLTTEREVRNLAATLALLTEVLKIEIVISMKMWRIIKPKMWWMIKLKMWSTPAAAGTATRDL